jgi:hypothetical protein
VHATSLQGNLHNAVKVAAGVKAPTRDLYTGRITNSLKRQISQPVYRTGLNRQKSIHAACEVFDEEAAGQSWHKKQLMPMPMVPKAH